jgi:hypothetical protein
LPWYFTCENIVLIILKTGKHSLTVTYLGVGEYIANGGIQSYVFTHESLSKLTRRSISKD